MADRVTVSNLALSLLGEDDQLRDPDEDTHAARSIRAVWDAVRRKVLRKGEFNFSIERHSLASDAAATADSIFPYSYAFPLPQGFIRLIEILDPALAITDYKLEKRRILASAAGPLRIRCVVDVPEVGDWDDLFVDAFAHRLGYQIAERITGDRSRKADCWNGYLKGIGETIGVDAVENPPEEPIEDDWVLARAGWGP